MLEDHCIANFFGAPGATRWSCPNRRRDETGLLFSHSAPLKLSFKIGPILEVAQVENKTPQKRQAVNKNQRKKKNNSKLRKLPLLRWFVFFFFTCSSANRLASRTVPWHFLTTEIHLKQSVFFEKQQVKWTTKPPKINDFSKAFGINYTILCDDTNSTAIPGTSANNRTSGPGQTTLNYNINGTAKRFVVGLLTHTLAARLFFFFSLCLSVFVRVRVRVKITTQSPIHRYTPTFICHGDHERSVEWLQCCRVGGGWIMSPPWT